MNSKEQVAIGFSENSLSEFARQRFLQFEKPLFITDWMKLVFIHFEIEPKILQPFVPFELDLYQGKAWVSLVTFFQERLHLGLGGRWTSRFFLPAANHPFLNVRTYVRNNEGEGIYFMVEWVSNRLATFLAPGLFGFPYRHGKVELNHFPSDHVWQGEIQSNENENPISFRYQGKTEAMEKMRVSSKSSKDEFLLERYMGFTKRGGEARYFRIWHEPWLTIPLEIFIEKDSLVQNTFPWFHSARYVSANYSPGVSKVWVGIPHSTDSDGKEDL